MKKILVVDDDAAIRRIARRALEPLGYVVVDADDGCELVSLAARERPSLILLDLHMPRLDGLAALSELLAALPSSSVIMMTGDGDERHAALALERGACDYLAKPFDVAGLGAIVETNLLVREALA